MPDPTDHGLLDQAMTQPAMAALPFTFAEESAAAIDPVEAYFECITTCSLDDGECITTCTEVLRQHGG